MVEAILPLLNVPILTPLIIATVLSPLVILAARALKYPKIVGLYVSAVFAYVLYEALRLVLSGPTFRAAVGQQPLSMISADGITYYFTAIVTGIALASSIYSLAYVRQRVGEFYALLLMMVLGMVGVFFSWDFVTFFVFWELMSITSYLLVAFNYREWEAVESSLKYLVMSSTGSAALLFGLSLLYGLCGTLDFAGLSKLLRSGALTGEMWSTVALVLILGGLGVNIALAPFHYWLPDAHPAAPSPISAMLSGVVIKTGVYAMVRVVTLFYPAELYGWSMPLMLLALLTMTIGNLLASLQSDIKRLLAFSSIANIGYIVFAISLWTPLALAAALLHVLNHALAKGLLFLSAGCMIEEGGSRSLDDLAGIGRRMPISATTYSIGAFSLAGIPGLNCFVSEYAIILAALTAGQQIGAAIMLINVIIGALYHLRVVQILFLKPETEKSSRGREVGLAMLLPVVSLAALCVVIGVYASPFLATVLRLAS